MGTLGGSPNPPRWAPASKARLAHAIGASVAVRIRELRAEGWRNLAAADAGTGRTAVGALRRQRPGQDQRPRGRVLPGGLRSFRTSHAEDLIRRAAERDGHGAPAGGDAPPGSRTPVRDRAAADGAGGAARRQAGTRHGGGAGRGQRRSVRARGPAAAARRAAARRRFLDLAIFNIERGYYEEASAFQKVLKNRNALLKRGTADPMLLDAYDEELARTGARVVMRRLRWSPR